MEGRGNAVNAVVRVRGISPGDRHFLQGTLPPPGLKWKSTLVWLADHMCQARTFVMTTCAACWHRFAAKSSKSHRALTRDKQKRLDQDVFVLTF